MAAVKKNETASKNGIKDKVKKRTIFIMTRLYENITKGFDSKV